MLVNGWNSLTDVRKSLTLDVVVVLDMPLVSEGYICDQILRKKPS